MAQQCATALEQLVRKFQQEITFRRETIETVRLRIQDKQEEIHQMEEGVALTEKEVTRFERLLDTFQVANSEVAEMNELLAQKSRISNRFPELFTSESTNGNTNGHKGKEKSTKRHRTKGVPAAVEKALRSATGALTAGEIYRIVRTYSGYEQVASSAVGLVLKDGRVANVIRNEDKTYILENHAG